MGFRVSAIPGGHARGSSLADQKVVYFRSASGRILRPVIESVRQSGDGQDWCCRVVFLNASSAPSADNPSVIQLLANGLRLAVRTRIELLDPYKGKLANERRRIDESTDPAEELRKANLIGSRVLEIFQNIAFEAEMQGTCIHENAPLLFEGHAQVEYSKLRTSLSETLATLKLVVSDEDKNPEKQYVGTERLLNELDRVNNEYIELAAPRFFKLLKPRASAQKVRARASSGSTQATRAPLSPQ